MITLLQLPCPLTPTTTPLESSVSESCEQRFQSVLADLSSMALPVQGGEASQGRPRLHPPGLLESGEHFLTVVLQTAQKLLDTEGVELRHPFDDKVSYLSGGWH